MGGQGISPAWDPGTKNIYYLTLSGIHRYSTDDRRKTLIRPASDLPGLAMDGQLAPHAFYFDGDNKELAYYDNDNETIYLVSLIDRVGTPETIKLDSGGSYVAGLEYIFDGSYLVLESGYMD